MRSLRTRGGDVRVSTPSGFHVKCPVSREDGRYLPEIETTQFCGPVKSPIEFGCDDFEGKLILQVLAVRLMPMHLDSVRTNRERKNKVGSWRQMPARQSIAKAMAGFESFFHELIIQVEHTSTILSSYPHATTPVIELLICRTAIIQFMKPRSHPSNNLWF